MLKEGSTELDKSSTVNCLQYGAKLPYKCNTKEDKSFSSKVTFSWRHLRRPYIISKYVDKVTNIFSNQLKCSNAVTN